MINILTKLHISGKRLTINWYSVTVTTFMAFFVFWLELGIGPALALEKVPLKSIAQITIDEEGRSLDYPLALFFDPVEEEIYVVNGTTARIVVYGPDYYPTISIGEGRGVFAPRGGQVLPNGNVYICQLKNASNSAPRITVLNGAFFVDKEIFLDETPGIEDFQPTQLAVSPEGIIYVAGQTSGTNRGVVVLDNDGSFLRLLQPIDQTRILVEEEEKPANETDDALEEEDSFADLPEEFRPREAGSYSEGLGPIRIHYVTLDSTGKLYMISDETSKIYVYGPNEDFLFSFGVKGGSPGQMSRPVSLAIDEKTGVIYVADYMRHTILVYDLSGKFLTEFGGRGYGEGWFNYPLEIALDNHGHVIVADLFNKRVQVLKVLLPDLVPEISDAVEAPTEQDEVVPGEQQGDGEQERGTEASSEQFDEDIEKDIVQDEDLSSEVPEFADEQEKEPETSLELPDEALEEEIILESPPVQLPGDQYNIEPLDTPE